MEDNKNTIEAENKTEANATTEAKTVTEAKKANPKKVWIICAIAFLALAIIATAVVLIVLGGNDAEPEEETYAEILTENISKYSLICAAGTSNKTMNQYWQLQTQIEKLCGVKPTTETDNNIDPTEFEILVGNTNREESQTFLSNLLWDDYGYAIIGNKIVIAGHTDEGTTNAMKHFLEHIKNGDHTTVFFSNKDQYLFRYPYVSDTFMLNGIDVSRAKIVVNFEGSDEQIANLLADKSLELCGRRPKIVTDFEVKAGDSLIIVGASTCVPEALQAEWDAAQASTEGQFSYYINHTDNVVWINTAVLEGYRAINRDILPQIQTNQTASITLSTGLVKVPQLFSVMSFNVCVWAFDDSHTRRVIDTILENIPSVFGVQEADVAWMTALNKGLGDIYTSVGIGRDGINSGEHSAIFYRTDMFNLVDSGTKWLSDTPDVMASKFVEANFPRVMTYAVLERKNDGVRFLYVNTHLDHDGKNSIDMGELVRQRQIEVLIAEIKKLGDLPTIVTGDFNVTDQASAYTTMIGAGFLDASRIAKEGEMKPTYNGMDDNYAGAIIDYIFVSPELSGAVEEYTVCPAKRDGGWVSDHNAIIATITLPTTEAQE